LDSSAVRYLILRTLYPAANTFQAAPFQAKIIVLPSGTLQTNSVIAVGGRKKRPHCNKESARKFPYASETTSLVRIHPASVENQVRAAWRAAGCPRAKSVDRYRPCSNAGRWRPITWRSRAPLRFEASP